MQRWSEVKNQDQRSRNLSSLRSKWFLLPQFLHRQFAHQNLAQLRLEYIERKVCLQAFVPKSYFVQFATEQLQKCGGLANRAFLNNIS